MSARKPTSPAVPMLRVPLSADEIAEREHQLRTKLDEIAEREHQLRTKLDEIEAIDLDEKHRAALIRDRKKQLAADVAQLRREAREGVREVPAQLERPRTEVAPVAIEPAASKPKRASKQKPAKPVKRPDGSIEVVNTYDGSITTLAPTPDPVDSDAIYASLAERIEHIGGADDLANLRNEITAELKNGVLDEREARDLAAMCDAYLENEPGEPTDAEIAAVDAAAEAEAAARRTEFEAKPAKAPRKPSLASSYSTWLRDGVDGEFVEVERGSRKVAERRYRELETGLQLGQGIELRVPGGKTVLVYAEGKAPRFRVDGKLVSQTEWEQIEDSDDEAEAREDYRYALEQSAPGDAVRLVDGSGAVIAEAMVPGEAAPHEAPSARAWRIEGRAAAEHEWVELELFGDAPLATWQREDLGACTRGFIRLVDADGVVVDEREVWTKAGRTQTRALGLPDVVANTRSLVVAATTVDRLLELEREMREHHASGRLVDGEVQTLEALIKHQRRELEGAPATPTKPTYQSLRALLEAAPDRDAAYEVWSGQCTPAERAGHITTPESHKLSDLLQRRIQAFLRKPSSARGPGARGQGDAAPHADGSEPTTITIAREVWSKHRTKLLDGKSLLFNGRWKPEGENRVLTAPPSPALSKVKAFVDSLSAPATPDDVEPSRDWTPGDEPDELVRTAGHEHVVVSRENGCVWSRDANSPTARGAKSAFASRVKQLAEHGGEVRRFAKRLEVERVIVPAVEAPSKPKPSRKRASKSTTAATVSP